MQALIEGGYLNFAKKSKKEKYQLESIPMTYTDLFPHLIANQLVKSIVLEPLTQPFLEWYNLDAYYDYHVGIPGYSIEDCAPFKNEVQRLIKSSVLSFAVVEQLINGVAKEDIAIALTTSNSYINVDENAIECSV